MEKCSTFVPFRAEIPFSEFRGLVQYKDLGRLHAALFRFYLG